MFTVGVYRVLSHPIFIYMVFKLCYCSDIHTYNANVPILQSFDLTLQNGCLKFLPMPSYFLSEKHCVCVSLYKSRMSSHFIWSMFVLHTLCNANVGIENDKIYQKVIKTVKNGYNINQMPSPQQYTKFTK